jgi:hypothetical protein
MKRHFLFSLLVILVPFLINGTANSAEIIGTWSSGIWYLDVAESEWTQMTTSTPTGDIAAGDFTGDGKADVASCWDRGLWYQDGDTLAWTKVSGTAPDSVTAGAGGASTEIAWIEGPGTIINYHYSGGLLIGMTFHRKFEVTSGSGNVRIGATLKDRSDSVGIIDEIADTFQVAESTEYEVLVHANVGGQGHCSPFDTDKMIFSSPSASTTSEITIMPLLQLNPATGQYDWYCVKNYVIDSITLN